MKFTARFLSFSIAVITILLSFTSCGQPEKVTSNDKPDDPKYKIVTPTDKELSEIGERLSEIFVADRDDSYSNSSDNIYYRLLSNNGQQYAYRGYDKEAEEFVSTAMEKNEGTPYWSEYIPENDPLGKFDKIPQGAYDENGKVSKESCLAYINSLDDYNAYKNPLVGGYLKYSGNYIDWLVEGVWNGKVDHDTFFDFNDNNYCYYSDGFYYTPYLIMTSDETTSAVPCIDKITKFYDTRYCVDFSFVDSDNNVYVRSAVLVMKENSDGFRFWSILSISSAQPADFIPGINPGAALGTANSSVPEIETINF